MLYHLNDETVRELFVTLGVDFESTLILPELQSAVRGLTSEVSAKALYTSGRTEIWDKLMAELDSKLRPRGIILEDVLLKGIKLPKQLINAIELKAQAEQESVCNWPFLFHTSSTPSLLPVDGSSCTEQARMEFVLTKEKQEADRKKIEAEGISVTLITHRQAI